MVFAQMSIHTNSHGQPLGPVIDSTPAQRPTATTLKGEYVTLVPLSREHADGLYPLISGPENAPLWTYMGYGPYMSPAAYQSHIATSSESKDPLFFTILPSPTLPAHFLNHDPSSSFPPIDPQTQPPMSILSYLNISLSNQSLEIGHILFTSPIQRTALATEALYLLMRHAFETLGYKRVEWKCHSLNAGSRRAAERLGFVYEGTFRRHIVAKGRRRDSWWASITAEEWWGQPADLEEDGTGILKGPGESKGDLVGDGDHPAAAAVVNHIGDPNMSRKYALEKWLHESNFDEQGKQRKRLEDFQAWRREKKRGQ